MDKRARRGEARRLHGRTDSTVSSLHAGRDVKLHVAGVFAIYVGALAKQQGVPCVHGVAQCTQPVTFALISYSYACADTSAIRAAPEIGRVFSSRWLRRKAFPMAFRCNRVHTGGLNQPSLETHRSTCACVRRGIYTRHVHLGWLWKMDDRVNYL